MIHSIAKNPSGRTHDQQRIEDARAADRSWDVVTHWVSIRDGGQCRLCGLRCRFGAAKLSERGDPHHIIFRSAGGDDSAENVLLLCRACHDDVHVHRRVALSGNANEQDELGRYRCVKAERLTDSGWAVEGLV